MIVLLKLGNSRAIFMSNKNKKNNNKYNKKKGNGYNINNIKESVIMNNIISVNDNKESI